MWTALSRARGPRGGFFAGLEWLPNGRALWDALRPFHPVRREEARATVSWLQWQFVANENLTLRRIETKDNVGRNGSF